MAALPPAAVAASPDSALPGDNYLPVTGGITYREAAIASADSNGGGGFVFDGTAWRPLR